MPRLIGSREENTEQGPQTWLQALTAACWPSGPARGRVPGLGLLYLIFRSGIP